MKRLTSAVLLTLVTFICSSFIIPAFPQDPPADKKIERQIKILKIDDQGNRIQLDTTITHDENFVWNGDTLVNHNFVFSGVPDIPVPPGATRMLFFGQQGDENVIDLKDSGIISFKKKKLSGDREKITIIRNKQDEKRTEKVQRIVVTGVENHNVMNNIGSLKEGESNIRVLRENGRNIVIREIRKNNEKEVEVEIEDNK